MENQYRSDDLGEVIRRARVMHRLTLSQLGTISGVSSSHLGRIERSERYPSGVILRKIAEPIGFEEAELMTIAGYLTPVDPTAIDAGIKPRYGEGLDPFVAGILAKEPVEVQRAILGLLTMVKSVGQAIGRNGDIEPHPFPKD